MKKFSFLFSIFVLSTTLNCDNEPLDRDIQIVAEVTCETAITNTTIAATAFVGATADNFQSLCNQLKVALQAQIGACGDTDGSLQTTIDSLDCTNENVDPCDIATNSAALAQVAFNAATDANYTQLCNAFKQALQAKKTACGDTDGSIQTIIDSLGNCSQSSGTTDHHALMTANLDGEQFNNMKPNGYNLFSKAIQMQTYSYANDEDYIWVQGNTTYNLISGNELTKEINLHIPESNWSVGTYLLQTGVAYAENGDINTHFNIIYNNGDGTSQAYEEEGGTITITEFNLTDRVIRGTFEFEYTRYFVDTNEETGPFQCINGTFDFALDDEYFD